MRTRKIRSVGVVTLGIALQLGACGGGGGGGASAPGSYPPPASPGPENRWPELVKTNFRVEVIQNHPLDYDLSQGGRTFSDPDGDRLDYEILWDSVAPADGTPPPGLTARGPRVMGAPEQSGTFSIRIRASDGHGGTATDWLELIVRPNVAPVLADPGGPVVVASGSPIDIDATMGGRRFVEVDGDPLYYEISFIADPRGLSIDGTRIKGVMTAPVATRLRIVASDGFGGRTEDTFLVAAPGPDPGRPTLPETSYIYEDSKLDLPHVFRISSQNQIPLWDTQPIDNRTSDPGATLGRVLFYDKRLSLTNMVSCGSCHIQANGFAATERVSKGVLDQPTARNAMGLTNVRYNILDQFFSDARVQHLERQALLPIEDPIELGNSLPMLEQKLAETDFYGPLFEAAFGSPEITADRVARALAQFLRALISYQSKFDRAYHPMELGPGSPDTVLTTEELRGAEIFIDSARGRCHICHSGGVQASQELTNNGLDEAAAGEETGPGFFRSASLRNIAITAPYMHDGRFATLREVIEHYDSGVKKNPDLSGLLFDGSSGEPIRLNLTEEEKNALEAFLNTLTDETFLTDPRFSDPFR